MEKEKKGIGKKEMEKKEKDKAGVGKREMEEAGTQFPVEKEKEKEKEAFWLPLFSILFFLASYLFLSL